jgi:hypothetical protein
LEARLNGTINHRFRLGLKRDKLELIIDIRRRNGNIVLFGRAILVGRGECWFKNG